MLPTRETVHSERTDGDYQFEAQRVTENRFGATGVIVALTRASRAIHSDEHGGERAAVPREGTRVSQRPHAQFVLLLEALPSWRARLWRQSRVALFDLLAIRYSAHRVVIS